MLSNRNNIYCQHIPNFGDIPNPPKRKSSSGNPVLLHITIMIRNKRSTSPTLDSQHRSPKRSLASVLRYSHKLLYKPFFEYIHRVYFLRFSLLSRVVPLNFLSSRLLFFSLISYCFLQSVYRAVSIHLLNCKYKFFMLPTLRTVCALTSWLGFLFSASQITNSRENSAAQINCWNT